MQIAKNNFTEGLVMDMSPEVTQNNCLTNALNATYITMNGNELQLQNDMGNAKFGAYLPSGYIPLGTTQLGGIVYVISYNPSNNKTQIGSFPSPQTKFLPSADMEDVSIDPTYFNTNLQYKKVYDDILMQPGDKFIFYFPNKTEELYKWYLYNPAKFPSTALGRPDRRQKALYSFLKMDVYTVSQEGKLLPLDLRKPYAIPNDSLTNAYVPVESDYNVYSSPVSGNLALVLSKVFCDNATLQIQALENPDDAETFILKFRYTFWSSDKFFFKFIKYNIYNNAMDIASDNLIYNDRYSSIPQQSDDNIATVAWYRNNERTMYKMSYTNTFLKEDFDGYDTYLEIQPFRFEEHTLANKTTKLIDISKLGTGDVQLSQYQYKFLDKEIQILFGFDTFLNVNESIKDITINIYESNNNEPIVSDTVSPETSSYTVSTNVVNMNNVYITEFVVHILQETGDSETEDTIRDVTITRWLVTIDQLFDESQIDYNDKTTVYYWEKSRNTELTLGEDTIEVDYSNAWSLQEDKEPITITEKHTFNKSTLITTIDYGSSVDNLVVEGIKDESIDLDYDTTIIGIDKWHLSQEASSKQLKLTSTFDTYTDYSIQGLRNHPQSLEGKYVIKRLKDIDNNKFSVSYFTNYQVDYSPNSPILYATGNADFYACMLFAKDYNKPGDTYPMYVYQTMLDPPKTDNFNPFKKIQGIYVRSSQNESTKVIISNERIRSNYEYTQKVADTMISNICVGIPQQDDIYYYIDFTSDSTKVTYEKSLQIEYDIQDSPDVDIILQNGTLESCMNNFKYNGMQPANLKIDYKQDKSRTSSVTNNNVILPDIQAEKYQTIHNDAVFLVNNKYVYPIQNEDNSSYTNNYTIHQLFYTLNNLTTMQFTGSKIVKINNISFVPNRFHYRDGYLSVDSDGDVNIVDSQDNTQHVCFMAYDSAIQ